MITSGYISNILYDFGGGEVWSGLTYAPGIIFGILMGIWIILNTKIKPIKIFSWVMISAIAYLIAYFSAYITGLGTYNLFLSFFLGGAIGASILALSTDRLIANISSKNFWLTTLLGGLSGLVFVYDWAYNYQYFFHSYIIWQTVIGITLGVLIEKNKTTNLDINLR
jgi:hypothetical protein